MGNCKSACACQPGCVSAPSMPALRNSRRSQRLGPAQHPSGMGLDALVQAGIAEAHQAFKTRKKGDKRKHIEKATGMLTEAYQRSSALGDHQDLNIHLTAVLLKLAEAQGTVLGASLGSLELDAVWLQGPCTLVEEPDAPSPEPDEVEPSLEAPPRQDGRREHEEQHGAAEGALPAAAAAAAAPGAPPAGGSKVGLSTVQEADGDSAGSVSDGGRDSPARPEVAPACGSPGPAAAEPEEPSAVLRPSPPQAGADPAGPRRGLGRLLRGLSGAPAEAEEAAQPPQPQASPLALSPEGGEAPGARRGLGRLLENLGLGPAPAPDAAEEQQPSPQAHASPQAGAEAAADEAPRLARWWSRMVGSADIGPEAEAGGEAASDPPEEPGAHGDAATSGAPPQPASVFARAFASPALRGASETCAVPAAVGALAGATLLSSGSSGMLTPASASHAPLQSPALASSSSQDDPTRSAADDYVSLDTREKLESLSKDVDFSVLRDWSVSKRRSRNWTLVDAPGSDTDSLRSGESRARTPRGLGPQRPGLELACPSQKASVRNPLEEPGLLCMLSGPPERQHRAPSEVGSEFQDLDTLSVCNSNVASVLASAAPSVAPSPFEAALAPRHDVLAPGMPTADLGPDALLVKILNGVSGAEEVRFPMHVQASPEHFLNALDQLCKHHAGQSLADLNWLSPSQGAGERFQRRKCDARMVEELFGSAGPDRPGATVLLCTVPVTPPSELSASKVRITKNVYPGTVACGSPDPVRVKIDTTALEAGREYSVAFKCQWTYKTYVAQATLLQDKRGVLTTVPWQMLASDGLYDVHLVIDGKLRSANHKTLNVGGPESGDTSATDVSGRLSKDSSFGFVSIAKPAAPPAGPGPADAPAKEAPAKAASPQMPATPASRWRSLRRHAADDAPGVPAPQRRRGADEPDAAAARKAASCAAPAPPAPLVAGPAEEADAARAAPPLPPQCGLAAAGGGSAAFLPAARAAAA